MSEVYAEKGGANALFILHGGRTVFVQKKVEHPVAALNDRMCMWGGACESGESPRECLAREIAEEFDKEAAELLLGAFARAGEPLQRRFQSPVASEVFIEQFTFEVRLNASESMRLVDLVSRKGMVREGAPVFLNEAQVVRDEEKFFPNHWGVILELMRM